ncbi:MAG: DNA-3-methyladenine glycosylase, partial [Burkholderiales bacterium]
MKKCSTRRLVRSDFNRPTLDVARSLLGKFIVCTAGRHTVLAMITELEAYKGPRDRAAHSFGGRRTRRVEPLYGEGGTVYVYLIYGLHWMLNFSTA